MSTQSPNYKIRYASNWGDIANFSKRLTQGKCVLCSDKAVEVHHARYADAQGNPIAGHEKPLIDVFPLCKQHHELAHHKDNWIHDFDNPVHGNRNTPEFHQVLLESSEQYRPKLAPAREPIIPILPVVMDEWEPAQRPGFNPFNLVYIVLIILMLLVIVL